MITGLSPMDEGVVLGAPLVIDAEEFKAASGQKLHDALSEICREIRKS